MITELLRRAELSFLIRLFERTFQLKKSPLLFCPADERLLLFRRISSQAVLGLGPLKAREMKRALYKRALPFGQLLGLICLPLGEPFKASLARSLYRGIGIDLVIEGEQITAFSCCFSTIYEPKCCAVMSGLDAGILCGLFNKKSLHFSRRLTQGCASCRAEFRKGQAK